MEISPFLCDLLLFSKDYPRFAIKLECKDLHQSSALPSITDRVMDPVGVRYFV